MQKDVIKKWAELSKNANAALKKINALNTSSIKKLAKLQMDMVSSCLEGGIKKTKNVAKVTSMSDLMNLQSAIYKDLSEKVLAGAQDSVKIAMETKQAMSALIKEGMADAPSMVTNVKKPVAKKVAPKPVAKKAVAKKVAPKPVAKKVVAKKATPKPVAKKVAPKPVAKKVVAKKAAPKPVAKKAAPKPAVKKVVAKKAAPKPAVKKAVAKKAAPKPAVKKAGPELVTKGLQMPKPSGRPMTEGDAKK
ncbi:MAG: phasin family protein [Piscirickettsiaceae bacterium]|nr:MAG: phasin family protein [Piscirickettsiaceae bacterium]